MVRSTAFTLIFISVSTTVWAECGNTVADQVGCAIQSADPNPFHDPLQTELGVVGTMLSEIGKQDPRLARAAANVDDYQKLLSEEKKVIIKKVIEEGKHAATQYVQTAVKSA